MTAAAYLFVRRSVGGVAMAFFLVALPVVMRLAMTAQVGSDLRVHAVRTALAVVMPGVIAGVSALTLPATASRGRAIVTGFLVIGTLKSVVNVGARTDPTSLSLEQAASRRL